MPINLITAKLNETSTKGEVVIQISPRLIAIKDTSPFPSIPRLLRRHAGMPKAQFAGAKSIAFLPVSKHGKDKRGK
ncbi:hypothetical protein L484_016649 [Morus notabilis]|uniref:Uncharacterized protein n=1 Tax=Morus notabilis TaxID=981085 RepID=W9RUS7_9ROSA|nr:hypothetical protein L484_016649 [Morus notabilis]